ncbi:MAG: hypothetical protein J0H68_04265 [Sphingobacteriia bacterium]|nr:hypothetical protein [Sphingobacteriia bacterium]
MTKELCEIDTTVKKSIFGSLNIKHLIKDQHNHSYKISINVKDATSGSNNAKMHIKNQDNQFYKFETSTNENFFTKYFYNSSPTVKVEFSKDYSFSDNNLANILNVIKKSEHDISNNAEGVEHSNGIFTTCEHLHKTYEIECNENFADSNMITEVQIPLLHSHYIHA